MRILLMIFLVTVYSFANQKIKIGVLAYGTVNWELRAMQNSGIAKKNGIDLEIIKLASKTAVAVALQAKAVDIIVSDFIWVNKQRARGYDYTFYPYSKALGALYVRPELNINTLDDLKEKDLGISGGPLDKTWLLLRAYSFQKYNQDLKDMVNSTYASPPILNKKLLDNSLDGTINFWHYASRLEAKGMKRLIGINEVLKEFDINSDISFVGWVFSEKLIKRNKKLINAFLQSSYESKKLLLNSNAEWEKIKPLMKVKNEKMFNALKQGYRDGIIKNFSDKHVENSKKVFNVLLQQGGSKLTGKSKTLDDGTFYRYNTQIQW